MIRSALKRIKVSYVIQLSRGVVSIANTSCRLEFMGQLFIYTGMGENIIDLPLALIIKRYLPRNMYIMYLITTPLIV